MWKDRRRKTGKTITMNEGGRGSDKVNGRKLFERGKKERSKVK